MFLKMYTDFESHVHRVNEQYKAIREMKDKLPKDSVLIQMDFSENYTCQTLEEIQSAYWNQSMITLHPAVIYYRDTDNELKHTSYVYVSDVLNHNPAMVTCIVDKLITVVKEIVPIIKSVNFWTDSLSSQYRNKTIFDTISQFRTKYGMVASWHYFESGHGKGPCDGVGGTTKRNADNAVKQGKTLIQDATDFFSWATQQSSEINYQFISEAEYAESKLSVDKRNTEIKPVKGSMRLHAVCGNDDNLMVRDTTCACDKCFKDGVFSNSSDCGWEARKIELMTKNKVSINQVEQDKCVSTDRSNDESNERASTVTDLNVSVGEFVLARYDINVMWQKFVK